jgi:hypothetical protein
MGPDTEATGEYGVVNIRGTLVPGWVFRRQERQSGGLAHRPLAVRDARHEAPRQSSMPGMRIFPLILGAALFALGLAMRSSLQAVGRGEHPSHLVIAAVAAAAAAFLIGSRLARED